MLLVFVVVFATIAAALTISAEYHGSKRSVFLFKPITVLVVIFLALIPKYPVSSFYRYMIIAGLLCSLAGDVFLMLPTDRFIQGLISFLIAHLFYTTAFVVEGGRSVYLWAAMPLVMYGGFMLWWLWRALGKMKTPVIVYMLALLLMALIASSRFLMTRQSGSLLAATGAVLFVVSDSILAVNRFRGGFRIAQFLILTTYFLAQCLIALST